MNDDPPGPGDADPIETIRREVDRIDRAVLGLLAERLKLADQLSHLKAPQRGLPLRPGREVALLRRLAAEAPAPIERELVVELWRVLMAASLRRQRLIEVAVGGGRGELFDIARRHFGARVRIRDLGEPQAALQRAADNPDSIIAVTTWPAAPGVGAWWPALSERRFHALQLIAALPVLSGGNEEPEAAVFAASAAEPAGGDESLILAFDPHHRVQRALGEAGLKGREIARAEPRVLLRIEGFVASDDARVATMKNAGLDAVRVLGAYARV